MIQALITSLFYIIVNYTKDFPEPLLICDIFGIFSLTLQCKSEINAVRFIRNTLSEEKRGQF